MTNFVRMIAYAIPRLASRTWGTRFGHFLWFHVSKARRGAPAFSWGKGMQVLRLHFVSLRMTNFVRMSFASRSCLGVCGWKGLNVSAQKMCWDSSLCSEWRFF